MTHEKTKNWDHWYLKEEEENATVQRMTAKRQVGQPKVQLGGKTPVNTSVSTAPSTAQPADDAAGAKGLGRGYDKSNDPTTHRPGSVEFSRNSYSPTNPQERFNARWEKAAADMEKSTRAAKSRQSGNYKQR
jgi:hypothetical protein